MNQNNGDKFGETIVTIIVLIGGILFGAFVLPVMM